MASVGLIINEKSERAASLLSDLLYITKRFSNVCTEVLDGVSRLGGALDKMNKREVDTLIVAGGDGTLQAVFTDAINNSRFGRMPGYVALPCGMTNVIANDCGLSGTPTRSLDNFLWRRQKGEVRPLSRPLLTVQPEGERPVYGFFMGAGVFCSAVDFSRSHVQSKGAKRSLALGMSVGGYIARLAVNPSKTISPVGIEMLDIDGAPSLDSESRLRTIYLATTLTRLGGGIYPFWGKGDGAMATTLVDYPSEKFLRAAISVVRGKSRPWFEGSGYRSWRSNGQTLRFDGSYVFDGEFFTAERSRPLSIKTSHSAQFLN
ncbi:MAG: diacylglycerol kinase family protein [Pseudomonadota bacterium]